MLIVSFTFCMACILCVEGILSVHEFLRISVLYVDQILVPTLYMNLFLSLYIPSQQ